MKEVLFWVVIISIVFFVFNIFNAKWSLFYYPEGCLSCVDKWVIQQDAYNSEEQCRDAGYSMNKARGYVIGDIFECGYKCKQVDATGYLCKKTIDF